MRPHHPRWHVTISRTLAAVLLALAVPAAWPAGAAEGPAPAQAAKPRHTNRLARESSPYLLQHAHNPVDWYPWGPEAFARAKKEGKFVFLSIGYSSCHWCHVMERESFENPAVAKLLNRWFVAIKVDREERPDIDHVYMTALSLSGQSGGWPLSMFLTADGKPIFGGTYWPPEDRETERGTALGFKSILQRVHDLQVGKGKELEKQADALAAATKRALAGATRGRAVAALDRELVTGVVDGVSEEYDKEYGGFGSADRHFRGPKFPLACYLQLLQREAARKRSADVAAMVENTLDHMALGGIYDQLGGGFHRYSTERTWTVPHFEKMLYDNAQLAEVYARAYRTTKKPLYRCVLLQTLSFVTREMTSPDGAFYSALDADSGGEEGTYYVWTDRDLDALLGADARLFKQVYGADGPPNFESKSHVLCLARPLADEAKQHDLSPAQLEKRLAPLRRKLLQARSRRSRPFLDTKVVTGWNGEMIAGLARAGQVLAGEQDTAKVGQAHIEAAARAADFILRKVRTPDGRLLRTYGASPGARPQARGTACLDDYAYLVHGLLCLHDATGTERWLDESRGLTDLMVKFYADDAGGFFLTASDADRLFARAKDQYDSAQPAANSVAALNLVRLWIKTRDDRYRVLAEKTFKSFTGPMKANPTSVTAMAEALAVYLDAAGDRAKQPADANPSAAQDGRAKRENPVKVSAEVKPEKPGDDGKQEVVVTLRIDKDWHIGANPPGEFGVATTVRVRARDKPEVKVAYPKGKAVKEPVGTYNVYRGTVVIKAAVRRAKGAAEPLQVKVTYSACGDKDGKCLPPETVEFTLPEKK
jgi:uncharacterized protein YyaL (SSP411 family)